MSSVPVPAPDGQVDSLLYDEDPEQQFRQGLLDAFAAVPDPRKARGTMFPLPAILGLIVLATITGCKNTVQIENFIAARPGLLPALGFRPIKKGKKKENRGKYRSPDSDTMIYILGRLDPEDLVRAFARWVNEQLGCGAAAAVDGKALRGTSEHVLTVFVGRLRLAVWQKPVDTKENEFSALEESLARLLADYPGLRLLTGDAMFCHKEIAAQIVEARRHYLLQLKSPHKTDQKIAGQVFAQRTQLPPDASSEAEKRGTSEGPAS